ncbi:replication-relaxation family protein [Embleya sp. NPDC050154]|uniref:replication-relaxation family protein n=1 Tax=Embleya sp. NPDC050154 TaxID=3363988 RepID=UPI0037A04678
MRPDAVLIWREGTTRSTLAVEYDTGTERLRRLVDKVEGYAIPLFEGTAPPPLPTASTDAGDRATGPPRRSWSRP